MNILKKICGVAAALVLLQGGTASADSADNLQAALASGVYTIRYENVTPPNRSSAPKEKTRLIQYGGGYNFEAESDFADPYTAYKVIEGIATSDGNNSYCEYSSKLEDENDSNSSEYANCTLTKGDETFNFKRVKESNGGIKYTSLKGKNKVEAVPAQYNQIGYKASNFGNATMTALMNALMPNENKDPNEKVYLKVRTGFNAEGLEYADYKATYTDSTTGDGVFLDVIRYFFRDGKLVKIYAGQYSRKGGVISGTRSIIDVTDFQTTAESSLLKLPAEITDVTKR